MGGQEFDGDAGEASTGTRVGEAWGGSLEFVVVGTLVGNVNKSPAGDPERIRLTLGKR